jgi:hypothetical protein
MYAVCKDYKDATNTCNTDNVSPEQLSYRVGLTNFQVNNYDSTKTNRIYQRVKLPASETSNRISNPNFAVYNFVNIPSNQTSVKSEAEGSYETNFPVHINTPVFRDKTLITPYYLEFSSFSDATSPAFKSLKLTDTDTATVNISTTPFTNDTATNIRYLTSNFNAGEIPSCPSGVYCFVGDTNKNINIRPTSNDIKNVYDIPIKIQTKDDKGKICQTITINLIAPVISSNYITLSGVNLNMNSCFFHRFIKNSAVDSQADNNCILMYDMKGVTDNIYNWTDLNNDGIIIGSNTTVYSPKDDKNIYPLSDVKYDDWAQINNYYSGLKRQKTYSIVPSATVGSYTILGKPLTISFDYYTSDIIKDADTPSGGDDPNEKEKEKEKEKEIEKEVKQAEKALTVKKYKTKVVFTDKRLKSKTITVKTKKKSIKIKFNKSGKASITKAKLKQLKKANKVKKNKKLTIKLIYQKLSIKSFSFTYKW